MEKPRPFVVTSTSSSVRAVQSSLARDDELLLHHGFMPRQDSLQPGEIHAPTMEPPTPFGDWTRGESQLWDSAPQQLQQTIADIWSSSGSNENIISGRLASDDGMPPRQSSGIIEAPKRSTPMLVSVVDLVPNDMIQGLSGNGAESLHGMEGRMDSDDSRKQSSMHRTKSEELSEELYRQAHLFPPPPPPLVPMEARRNRADLWYYYASKWDITHRLPLPPRNPLAGMEEEFRLKLQPLTRVPYRGDRWLASCQYWHEFVQGRFEFPPTNQLVPTSTNLIYDHCVLDGRQ